VLVSLAAGATAVVILHRLARPLLGPAGADTTALLVTVYPIAFVFTAPYSDALFLALAAGSFLAAVQRRLAAYGLYLNHRLGDPWAFLAGERTWVHRCQRRKRTGQLPARDRDVPPRLRRRGEATRARPWIAPQIAKKMSPKRLLTSRICNTACRRTRPMFVAPDR
jgi:hypothetical protein